MNEQVRAALDVARRAVESIVRATRRIRELIPGEPKHSITISTPQALTLLGLIDSMDDTDIGRLASERAGMTRVQAALIEGIASRSCDAPACRLAIDELLSAGRSARREQFSILHPSS